MKRSILVFRLEDNLEDNRLSIKALISLVILDTKTNSVAGAVGGEQVTTRVLENHEDSGIYIPDGECK